MNTPLNHTDTPVHQSDTQPKNKRPPNGADPRRKKKHAAETIPGVNIFELYAERNWTALGGLALIAVGVYHLVQDMLSLHFELWTILLLALGVGLMLDAWKKYQAAGQVWVKNTYNRMLGGSALALVGLINILPLNGWSLLLFGIAGWLAYDTRQIVETSGWTERARSRMLSAGLIGAIGLIGIIGMGSTWPWLVIIIGGAMFFRHFGSKRCC